MSNLSGFKILPGFLTKSEQAAFVADLWSVVEAAPFYTPTMPKTGKPMSVRMTNCGALGWVTDKDGGYRYQSHHPVTTRPWPPIPERILEVWHALADYPHPAEACLINYYDPKARMGLHQDRDEDIFSAPVISLSFGADCRFRIGGLTRRDPTRSVRLSSGDVVILGGEARLAFHGVDRIYANTSTLLPDNCRMNVTLRRVTKP